MSVYMIKNYLYQNIILDKFIKILDVLIELKT